MSFHNIGTIKIGEAYYKVEIEIKNGKALPPGLTDNLKQELALKIQDIALPILTEKDSSGKNKHDYVKGDEIYFYKDPMNVGRADLTKSDESKKRTFTDQRIIQIFDQFKSFSGFKLTLE